MTNRGWLQKEIHSFLFKSIFVISILCKCLRMTFLLCCPFSQKQQNWALQKQNKSSKRLFVINKVQPESKASVSTPHTGGYRLSEGEKWANLYRACRNIKVVDHSESKQRKNANIFQRHSASDLS